MAGEVVVRQARLSDARAIAEVSVASRRWSYRDLLAEADLEALSVEETAADFAEGLAELPLGAAVFVAELTGRIVGYAYVLPSPDADVPAETSELGSIYVTEEVAGRGAAPALMDAAIERARAAGQGALTLWVRQENGRARRFYEKHGMRPDGAERSRPHDVLPTEMHEIRYRMSLDRARPSQGTRRSSSTRRASIDPQPRTGGGSLEAMSLCHETTFLRRSDIQDVGDRTAQSLGEVIGKLVAEARHHI